MKIKFRRNLTRISDYRKIKRCLIDKDVTLFNIVSHVLFYFLICMTFEKAAAHHKFGGHCINIFANCQEFRGTYSYCEIADEFGLTNTLKRFSYIRRVMKREPHNKLILLYFKLQNTVFRYIQTIKYKGRPFKREFDNISLEYY